MTEQADKARNPDQQLDIPQQIDADYGVAIERLDSWIDDGI
jgi:small conductance mechanosensitive channel